MKKIIKIGQIRVDFEPKNSDIDSKLTESTKIANFESFSVKIDRFWVENTRYRVEIGKIWVNNQDRIIFLILSSICQGELRMRYFLRSIIVWISITLKAIQLLTVFPDSKHDQIGDYLLKLFERKPRFISGSKIF